MKFLLLLHVLASNAFAIEAKELVELAKKPSNYHGDSSAQALYKLKKDEDTERWVQWDGGPHDGGHVSFMKVTRRMVEGGALVETRTGMDIDKPKIMDFIEITRANEGSVWSRWRLHADKESKWILESTWEGKAIRGGFINWRVVAEVDGWGMAHQWRKGKVAQWVHERINKEGCPVLAYSEPNGDDGRETGIIYYTGSEIEPPYR